MKYYYTLLHKKPQGEGTGVVCTNLAKLAKLVHGEEDYKKLHNRLTEIFSRQKKTWWESPYDGILVIKSFKLIKGDQRVSVKNDSHLRNFNK